MFEIKDDGIVDPTEQARKMKTFSYLEDKLADYKERLQRYRDNQEIPKNQTREEVMVRTKYKIEVLENFLNFGKTDSEDLRNKIKQKFGDFDENLFKSVCLDIEPLTKLNPDHLTDSEEL